MEKFRILVVDDEEGMLEVCADTLRRLPDTEIHLESNSNRAAEIVSSERFNLLITDIRMPGLSGVELLKTARQHDPHLSVLMLTAFPSVETAVETMKLGAVDYITKPFIPDDLLCAVSRILEHNDREAENLGGFDEIVGRSPAMLEVFDRIQRVASTDVDVLIVGETGTGKELVARSVHKRSRRNQGRFVPVDCGAIPEDLLESELFGHERGAFTGAHNLSLGLLEFANRGTFFLDEIGELPLHLQAKLLRAIQERKIRRVGGKEEIDLNVRIVAATARELSAEIQQKHFREDLYYRINVARIDLPSLRDRKEDIPLLVEHFLQRYGGETGKEGVRIDPNAMDVLQHYPWPGNVRELQNVLRRTLAMMRHEMLTMTDLPDEILIKSAETSPSTSGSQVRFLHLREERMNIFEKEYLVNLLHTCHGDVCEAAREARIPRATLYRLLKKHEVNPKEFRS